jgi:two-component system nitrate/nitrite response regulator NarL
LEKESLRIVIADDHQMFMDGVRSLLRKDKRFVFVKEALTGEDAFHFISSNPVDLLITDISMPGMSGTELTKKTKQQFPDVKVLVLTMFKDRSVISEIIESEAEGYILKNTGRDELIAAIEKIMDNGTYYSQEVLSELLLKQPAPTKNRQTTDELTERELEILKLIAGEHTTAEIAEKLFISPRTVDTHRKNILEKTNSRTIVGLMKYVFENGLL